MDQPGKAAARGQLNRESSRGKHEKSAIYGWGQISKRNINNDTEGLDAFRLIFYTHTQEDDNLYRITVQLLCRMKLQHKRRVLCSVVFHSLLRSARGKITNRLTTRNVV